ncbi:hypothetical protein L6164_005036 [Bauhinia variegata]|uniref:Uncharacterized protein n=1 Tax=Bauhinia variegata TaxID=167791 RepID=A0ACB9PQ06_BAUVA|nr:hypothetical protein L6164_005036 [Bauhinia variegata]
MIKLGSKRFCRSSSKLSRWNKAAPPAEKDSRSFGEIKWEVRPGGMLVQKREINENAGEGIITIRVSTVSQWHDISIEATSTFGELKMMLSLVTSLEPIEQRILFRGKERDDNDYLHMVGVRDKDKVLLLEDPAIKEKKKLLDLAGNTPRRTISV